MNPWDKNRQTIRFNRARLCEAPHWAHDIDRGAPMRSGAHYFLQVAHECQDFVHKFSLERSSATVHKSDGTIPTRAAVAVIKPLNSTLEIPYALSVSTALADYAITSALHALGSTSMRLSIERMDSDSWTLLAHSLEDQDQPPFRMHSTSGQPEATNQPSAESLNQAVALYRGSCYALHKHNFPPATTNDVSVPKVGKRFTFSKLFR